MEDNIQTIITVIISAFLLFIFPVYMAYEKKDDISYALAMRYTQDFVDNVRSRGYLTMDMYEDYVVKLGATSNTYDIELTHEYNRYDPITNYYKIEDGKYVVVDTSTQEQRKTFENKIIEEAIKAGQLLVNYTNQAKENYLKAYYNNNGIAKVEDTYMLSTQVYETDYILQILKNEKKFLYNSAEEDVNCEDNNLCMYAYIMNEDDNFNVTIKNNNITLATVMYNMVTANTIDNNTRIYVNYGGTILSSKWYDNIDYSVMDHDNITVAKYEESIIFKDEKIYPGDSTNPKDTFNITSDEYVLEFEIKPGRVTELREKGTKGVDAANYNLAFGLSNNATNKLSVSVGVNGISFILNSTSLKDYKVILSYPATINEYVKVKIEVVKKDNGKYVAILYLDDEKVAESIEVDQNIKIDCVGNSYLSSRNYFKGAIKNVKIKTKVR